MFGDLRRGCWQFSRKEKGRDEDERGKEKGESNVGNKDETWC